VQKANNIPSGGMLLAFFVRLLTGEEGRNEEWGRSSGKESVPRRTLVILLLNFDEAMLIGEHKQNVGRTPAKPPFPGEEWNRSQQRCAPDTCIKSWHK